MGVQKGVGADKNVCCKLDCYKVNSPGLCGLLQDAQQGGGSMLASFVVEGVQPTSPLGLIAGVAGSVLAGALLAAIGSFLIVYSLLGAQSRAERTVISCY